MTVAVESQTPDIREYLIGGLSLLASPKDIMSLSQRRLSDPRLDRLLRMFANPKTRQEMFIDAWELFDTQCEYKYKNKGSPYFIVFGTRGLGKSEVAATIMERCRDMFELYLSVRPIPGFGRNPSDMNELLAKATLRGIPAVIIGDETESEVGEGKNTEEAALIDNLETIRVLQHTLIRCANRFKRLQTFSYYCDFVFEVIFSDRINGVNYCIMYTIEEETEDADVRNPVGIINVPLHENHGLREIYENMKDKEQRDFTSSGGRRSRKKKKLEPVVVALVEYVRNRREILGKIKAPKSLKRILVFHIERGDKWNLAEQELICDEAFARLKGELTSTGGSAPRGSAPGPVKSADDRMYKGQTHDFREAVFKRLIERGADPMNVKALQLACEKHISQEEVALMLGLKQPTVSGYIRQLSTEHESQGNSSELGFAFEDVYSATLTQLGKKHLLQGGYSPEPDIIIFAEDGVTPTEVHTLKCMVQKRDTYNIPRSKIGAKEIQFSQEHNIPLYLVYYDIWHDKIHRVLVGKEDSFNFPS